MTTSYAFIGGTGPEGLGLAVRLALTGQPVIIGSRVLERAQEATQKIREAVPSARVEGLLNLEAAQKGDIVFITVPFSAQRDTLVPLRTHLAGKIVVSVVSPLAFERGRARAIRVEEGSAAEQARALLPESRLVSAFHNVSAEDLIVPDRDLGCDVVACGDDQEAKQVVMKLAAGIKGIRAIDGGPLANSRYVEDLTALLLNINRIYKAHTSIKIIGL